MKRNFTPTTTAIKNGLLILYLLNSPQDGLGITAAKRLERIPTKDTSMTTSTRTITNGHINIGITCDDQNKKTTALCADNTKYFKNYLTEMIAGPTVQKLISSTHVSTLNDGSSGPARKLAMEVQSPSTYKGENRTNASVTHRRGVDTEEAVIETAQYAAPELKIPIEPPERGRLQCQYHKQQPRTTRGATEVSTIISRRSTSTLATEMIISRDYRITFGHATHASVLQSGAILFTVMQEDTKRSFAEEAPIEILAVKLLCEEIKSNWTWDVWIGHAIIYSQGQYTSSCPRLASRNEVEAKRHE